MQYIYQVAWFARALGIACAVAAVIRVGVDLLNKRSSDERTLEFALFVACIIWMLSAISKWKKRNIAPPLKITIDDTGTGSGRLAN